MNIKVISAFAGLGKTTVGNKYYNVCDLQSSPYKYDYSNIDKRDYEKMKCVETRNMNQLWPTNYLNALKIAMKKYDIVFVPANDDVRQLLLDNNIKFLFVLPSIDSRKILYKRYLDRNNNKKMIENALQDFDNWSRKEDDYPYPIAILEKNKYLEDLLLELNILKNGTI